ncbi:putative TauD/TfdA-like domain, taurine dioxygenase TauD-like superfamily [Helianthus debilis subsp. tardiflorus]
MEMATGRLFQEIQLPEQKSYDDGIIFPLVLSPNTAQVKLCAFKEAIRDHKPWLESLLHKNGAILFRGFPVISPSDFNDVVEAFGFPESLYVGGRASRTKVIGRIYTANECPPEMRIPFHHEMTYVPDSPSKLFFFCEEEPGSGGETPIVLSHIIYEKMKETHPDFVSRLEEHGVTYIMMMSNDDHPSSFTGSSWKSAYMTDDKKVAQQRAAKLGTKLEWTENAVKTITGPLPAIRFDKGGERKTWFNNLTGPVNGEDKIYDKDIFIELGNGEVVPEEAMRDCLKILEEECVSIPWKNGDIMLVNNLMVLHSRMPLLKPPRRILASLCK